MGGQHVQQTATHACEPFCDSREHGDNHDDKSGHATRDTLTGAARIAFEQVGTGERHEKQRNDDPQKPSVTRGIIEHDAEESFGRRHGESSSGSEFVWSCSRSPTCNVS